MSLAVTVFMLTKPWKEHLPGREVGLGKFKNRVNLEYPERFERIFNYV